MKHIEFLFFVLYDSITNSIFDGQIAQPLLERKKNNPNLNIIIISFEKNCDENRIKKIIEPYNVLKFVFFKKYPFITPLTLFPAIRKLRRFLSNYSQFALIARGPLAGYICLHSAQQTFCEKLIIQSRGALAEEYRYATQDTTNWIIKKIQQWRAQQFQTVESLVYRKKSTMKLSVIIEAVSAALKEYLIKTYNADPQSIILAQHDIPKKIPHENIKMWRKQIREELGINDQTIVYCYNGSLKPWQCPQETITYFNAQLKKNNHCFLLVLSQDKTDFEKLLKKENIQTHHYTILSVPHHEIYKYLAASDKGIIFREKNIINWVSRPTKILEYQAVGLPIIHNNTIALLFQE